MFARSIVTTESIISKICQSTGLEYKQISSTDKGLTVNYEYNGDSHDLFISKNMFKESVKEIVALFKKSKEDIDNILINKKKACNLYCK